MRRTLSARLSFVPLLMLAVLPAARLAAQQRDRIAMARAIDSLAAAPIAAGRAAGMSIAVVRGADTIALKTYGYADLEFDVPTPDRATYQIGSITKQFTAAAVYQLRDRGLLSLEDEITKYLPDYPTQGNHVTVRRLMNHTSGIKGYTEMPVFWDAIATRELPPDSLTALFAKQPFDFAPGDAMIYNNSAFFLLGLIIEKASGERYADYVQKHLFEPAGMRDSHYCSDYAVEKRRAHGYDSGPNGLQRARFLVHRWPFAAGSLCSTTRDLVAWNHALHGPKGRGGTILPAGTYQEYMTPDTLNDGTRLRYAHGLGVVQKNGRRVFMHGGGIFGFLSDLRYYPNDDLSVVVLINTGGPVDPGDIADGIEEIVLGKPAEPPRTFAGDLGQFAGTYTGTGRGQPLTITVSADSGRLTLGRGPGRPERLRYLDGLTFGAGTTLYRFVREGDRVAVLRADQVGGYYILKRTQP